MANVQIYKCLQHVFALALTLFQRQKQIIFYLQQVRQFSQLHHPMANVKNLQMSPKLCLLALTFSEILKFKIFTSKSRSRSRSAIFSIIPFDSKCQNLQTSFFALLIIAKVWHVRMGVTHTYTCTHTQAQKRTNPGYRRFLRPKNKSRCSIILSSCSENVRTHTYWWWLGGMLILLFYCCESLTKNKI